MAYGKSDTNQHKRMAMGQKVTGLKSGGRVHSDAAADKKMMAAEFKKRGLKRGGKVKRGC